MQLTDDDIKIMYQEDKAKRSPGRERRAFKSGSVPGSEQPKNNTEKGEKQDGK